jgi:hypothetical protein
MGRKAAPLNPDDFFKTQRSNESVKEYLSKPEDVDVDIDIAIPNDVTNVGFETTTAPTQKPSRPRALTIAYNPNTKTVYIVFRTNHWHQYNDVSTEIWLGLKNSASTNDYLPTLESACSSHEPAQLRTLSAGTVARLSDSSARASSIQRGDLRNWGAFDFFKEN